MVVMTVKPSCATAVRMPSSPTTRSSDEHIQLALHTALAVISECARWICLTRQKRSLTRLPSCSALGMDIDYLLGSGAELGGDGRLGAADCSCSPPRLYAQPSSMHGSGENLAQLAPLHDGLPICGSLYAVMRLYRFVSSAECASAGGWARPFADWHRLESAGQSAVLYAATISTRWSGTFA